MEPAVVAIFNAVINHMRNFRRVYSIRGLTANNICINVLLECRESSTGIWFSDARLIDN